MKIAGEYDRPGLDVMCRMMALTGLALNGEQRDFLGAIYEEEGFSASELGRAVLDADASGRDHGAGHDGRRRPGSGVGHGHGSVLWIRTAAAGRLQHPEPGEDRDRGPGLDRRYGSGRGLRAHDLSAALLRERARAGPPRQQHLVGDVRLGGDAGGHATVAAKREAARMAGRASRKSGKFPKLQDSRRQSKEKPQMDLFS